MGLINSTYLPTHMTSDIQTQKGRHSTSAISDLKRDRKHRQRNGRRQRFVTEEDWAKGFVFGGVNEV